VSQHLNGDQNRKRVNTIFFMSGNIFFWQKWTQENSRLPEHLQRITPQKPEHQNVSVDDWNRLAWEATQVNYAHIRKR